MIMIVEMIGMIEYGIFNESFMNLTSNLDSMLEMS